jgi:MoaA/NifB/PqqE/SkfB family radical SAM enzyme
VLTRWLDAYRKLEENQAFSVLLHPGVLANCRRFVRELEERPLVMRSQPTNLEIELTNRCDLACIQCLRSQGLRPYKLGDITPEHFERILSQFPNAMNLGLNGFGEPLLHREFFTLVAHARARLPWTKIVIYSNGNRLDEPTCERLPESGLTEINVSIDAAYPDTYKKVRRGGSLTVVHDNLRRLVRARQRARTRLPLIGVNYVLLNENEGELVPFIEQAAEIGVDFVNCVSYATYDWGFRNRRTRDSYRRELDAARKRLAELDFRCRTFPSDDLSWTDPMGRFDCGFFWGQSIRVTYDGTMTLGCCTPFKETYSYGNLLTTPFEDIWNGEAIRHNRLLTLHNEAPNASCVSCDKTCKTFFDEVDERKYIRLAGVGN